MQVDVPHASRWIQAEWLDWKLTQFSQDSLQIEGVRCHFELSIRGARPLVPGTIAVDLDPITFRVRQIDSFTDEMVGVTLDGCLAAQQVFQNLG
jgi:hypothetical protein